MSTVLSIVSRSSVSETTALVVSGRVTLEDFGTALCKMPEDDAREHLQALPVTIQSTVVRLAIGGGSEAPLLCLMKAREAATAVMLDGAMFEVTSLMTDVMRADANFEIADVNEERRQREVVVIDANGNHRVACVYINPERAWVYFQTVARSTNQTWRERVMKRLGISFLAFIYASVEEDEIDVDIDDWEDCLAKCDDDYREDALTLGKRRTSKELETDLVDRHAASMKKAFKLSEDFMKNPEVASAKADDLVGDLDLG